MEVFFSKNVVEDYVDAAVKQALQIHLTPSKGKQTPMKTAIERTTGPPVRTVYI